MLSVGALSTCVLLYLGDFGLAVVLNAENYSLPLEFFYLIGKPSGGSIAWTRGWTLQPECLGLDPACASVSHGISGKSHTSRVSVCL